MIEQKVRELVDELVAASINTGVTEREILEFVRLQFKTLKKRTAEEATAMTNKVELLAEEMGFCRNSALFWQATEVFCIIYEKQDEQFLLEDIAKEMAENRKCCITETRAAVSNVFEVCIRKSGKFDDSANGITVIRELLSEMNS